MLVNATRTRPPERRYVEPPSQLYSPRTSTSLSNHSDATLLSSPAAAALSSSPAACPVAVAAAAMSSSKL